MNIPRASIWPTVSFDTTTDAGMAAAERWLASVVEPQSHTTPENVAHVHWGVSEATVTPGPELEALPDEEEAYHRRNAWIHQPPKPGTHESDLGFGWRTVYGYLIYPGFDVKHGRGGDVEYRRAARWSRENAR